MGRSRQPRLPLPDDGALITRTLWSDSEALRTAESWVRRRIYGLEKEQARALYELYLKNYREVAGTLTMAYGDDGKPVFARRAILLEQMEREINALIAQAEAHIDTALIDAYEQGYAGRAWVLDQATNPNIPIRFRPVLPAQAIRSLLLQPMMGRDRRYMGQDWHTELGFAREEFVLRTKRSLTASMVQGEGIGAAMRRLRDEYGIQTDRRKGFTRNFYQTTMIARTEILRASNLGALAVYEENADILSGWEWTATKDERTCPICGAMDGKRFKFNDPQLQPPSGSHPGCRCTIVPVLKDERLMNEVAGIRETYGEWAARNGMITDGGLDKQRGAAPTSTGAGKSAREGSGTILSREDFVRRLNAQGINSDQFIEEIESYVKEGYKALRMAQKNPDDPYWGQFLENANLIEAGLRQMPYYDGKIYRGFKFVSEEEWRGPTAVGEIVQLKAMASFSREIHPFYAKEGHIVYEVIQNRSGVSIERLSTLPDETEVLVPSGTTYRVVSITRRAELPPDHPLYVKPYEQSEMAKRLGLIPKPRPSGLLFVLEELNE